MPFKHLLIASAATLMLVAPLTAQHVMPLTDTLMSTASRTPLGGTARVVDVIDRATIARSTARNLAALLSERIGIDVYGRSAAQADISIRGSTAEQTLILVDGVRVSDAQSSHYALDLAVPLEAIDRIEILHGGGSAMYGPDAVGGVINIITRESANHFAGSVRGGGFGTLGGSAAHTHGFGATLVGLAADFEQSDGFRLGTEHKIGQGRATVDAPLGAGHLTMHAGFGIRDFGADHFYGPYPSVERTGAYTADAGWRVPVGSWSLAARAATREHTDLFTLFRDNPSYYQNQHTSWQHTGELVARTAFGAASLALGTDLELAKLTSVRLGNHDEDRVAAFGEFTLTSSHQSSLNVGLREDHSSIYGAFTSPSVAVAVLLLPHATMHASASRGFRAPTWTERYYVDPANQGNAALDPERFWLGDAGVRFNASNGVALDITGFARNAEQLIDWVKPAGAAANVPWVATNVGDARYRGFEAMVTLPTVGRLRSSLGGTLLSFTDVQGTGLNGKYALRPITRQGTVHLSYDATSAVGASVDLLAARRATEEGYVTGNARLFWRHGAVRVNLDVTNLTDARWLDASGIDVAGRALFLGISWSGSHR